MQHLYEKWKAHPHLPIECLVNVMLLYREARPIVQLDNTYYPSKAVRDAVEAFVRECKGVVARKDASGNDVLYLSRCAARIEDVLRSVSSDGTVEGAFQTTAFSRLLDPQFYVSKHTVRRVLKHPNVVRVAINVIQSETKSGALLVQMSFPTSVCAAKVYARYRSISRVLESIDPALQTSLVFYSKPGMWKDSDEYVVKRYATLPP